MNPEGILAAAHAACFTMAFSFACDNAGFVTQSVDTRAHVRLSPKGEGFEIDRNTLKLSTAVPGIDGARVLGDAHAKLALLEYGDYECPACIQAEPLMQHLVEAQRGRMRFVFRHFPLMEVHPNEELAAEAAKAAAAQGQFWPMHHLLFSQVHHLAPAALAGYAQSLGLDMNRFNAETGDRIYTQRVQEHCRAGARSGLRATPAMFLNGRVVDVSLGFEKLVAAVLASLKAG